MPLSSARRSANASIAYEDALPSDDVDLTPFAQDIVSGIPKSTWPGRSKNLVEHFQKLLPECIGQSRIAHLTACCIVTIRRSRPTPCATGAWVVWLYAVGGGKIGGN